MPTGRENKMYTARLYFKKIFWIPEFGEEVFLESGGWDEWQTFENQLSFDFEKLHEFYNKGVCYIHSPLLVCEIWVHMARFYYQNSDY